MAEYIERDKAIDELRQYIVDPKKAISDHPDDIEKFNDGIDTAISVLSTLPIADVQPVKHGKWVESFEQIVDLTYKVKRCSICGKTKPMKIFEHEDCLFNYCSNCGARMDGDT